MAQLKPYAVTIRVFDPAGDTAPCEHVLPVDSPDEEHAVAATLSNAVAFTTKTSGGRPLPVAFCCVRVASRA